MIVGFATTLKHFFQPKITVNYPDQKIPVFPKWRGKQVLMRDEGGLEKCVACGLCAVACPADAIYLEAAENDGSVQAGPRYAKVYQIHKTRCIFCGMCEEACPVSAIFMGKDYELAVYSNKDFIWDKTDLLVPAGTSRLIGALGDIHGDFAAARRIVARHPEVPIWLCVGDIATDSGIYESIGAPVYWVHGNNDNFDAIAAGELPDDLCYIPNGTVVEIGVRVAALGGTFAPTWYESDPADLPHPKKGSARATALADAPPLRPRHVEACKALRGKSTSCLTHEAAKPFRPAAGGRGPDAGKAQINEVLAAMKPRLHLFGHHHRFSDQDARRGALDRARSGLALVPAHRRGVARDHYQSVLTAPHCSMSASRVKSGSDSARAAAQIRASNGSRLMRSSSASRICAGRQIVRPGRPDC